MCLNPRKILNPSLSWHDGMPKYLVVRCNQCAECRARRQEEWIERCEAEWQANRAGSTFFVTLTFRNEDLPHFEDKRDYQFETYSDGQYENLVRKVKKSVDFSFDCFDSEYLTTFCKEFRTYVSRLYPDKDTTGIKFFICSEYGEHTKRPHHHLDIFSPFFFPVKDFKKVCGNAWTHGFIGASKNKGFLVKSKKSFSYTCKYSCKDLYFHNKVMDNYLDKENLDPAEYKYRYNLVKKHLPRLRVSNHFGESLVNSIRQRKDVVDYCCTPNPLIKVLNNGKVIGTPLPQYVMNKLCREIDKEASKVLGKPYFKHTQLGLQIKREFFKKRLKVDSIELMKFRDSRYILQTLSQVDFSDRKLQRDNISKSLPELLRNIDLDKLSFYRKLLRYLPVSKYGKHTVFWYNCRSDMILNDFFSNNYIPRDLYNLWMDDYFVPPKTSVLSSFSGLGIPLSEYGDLSEVPTLSDLGEFKNYERCCQMIDKYNELRSRQNCKAIINRNKRVEKTRSMFAEYNLYDSEGKIVV